jgi:hypothetical protein
MREGDKTSMSCLLQLQTSKHASGMYGLSERRFGDGSAAAVAAFASCVAKGGRRKQGLVPDIGVHFG